VSKKNYQLSIINYQLSIVNYQFSIKEVEHLSTILVSIIGAVVAIWGAWFTYNQKVHNDKHEHKLEKMRAETAEKMAINNRHYAMIYGYLGELLHKLDIDRCFIIQPHPEHKHLFLSVAIEVDRKGISAVKDSFQNVPISDMAVFVKELATKVWLYFDDVNNQVECRKAQALMFMAGSVQIAIRQLVNAQGSWIGSLVVENINQKEFDKEDCMEIIKNTANVIQFVLPPIQ